MLKGLDGNDFVVKCQIILDVMPDFSFQIFLDPKRRSGGRVGHIFRFIRGNQKGVKDRFDEWQTSRPSTDPPTNLVLGVYFCNSFCHVAEIERLVLVVHFPTGYFVVFVIYYSLPFE